MSRVVYTFNELAGPYSEEFARFRRHEVQFIKLVG